MPEHVPAMVLAGGESRRMGVCKQLLPLGDRPVIVHGVETLKDAGVTCITVVAGKYADAIRQVLSHLMVSVVENRRPGADMADSVRVGLAAMDPIPAGMMICLSDHPLVKSNTIETLLETQKAFPGDIVVPVFEKRNGHPVIFPAELLNLIRQGGTLRDIINAHSNRIRRIPVNDSGVVTNMNTPEDYQKMVSSFRASRRPRLKRF